MHNAFRHRFLLKEGGEIVADVDRIGGIFVHEVLLSVVQVPCHVPSTPFLVCGLTALSLPACLSYHTHRQTTSVLLHLVSHVTTHGLVLSRVDKEDGQPDIRLSLSLLTFDTVSTGGADCHHNFSTL